MKEGKPLLGIALLAAGSSSRMGQSKQSLIVDQQPLLTRACYTALESSAGNNVVVVLGANDQAHRGLIQHLPISIVHNDNWQSGMGSSIKAGVQYLIKTIPAVEGIIVLVCDQPALTTAHINSLVENYQHSNKNIIASEYAGTTGVPVLFSKNYFQELMLLGDHEGAKKLIQQHSKEVIGVDFPGGEIDLDTMDDYDRFLKRQ